MSDMGDDFKALREYNRAKKQRYIAFAIETLNANGVEYKNRDGLNVHLMIEINGQRIDFWPSTGRWRTKGKSKFGIASLMAYIRSINNR